MKIIIHPSKTLCRFDPEDSSIGEAIYSIYKNNPSPIIEINWNNLRIEIDGISLSKIIFDISNTLALLKANKQVFIIHFFDNAFTAKWQFTISEDVVNICSEWTALKGYSSQNKKLDQLRALNEESINKAELIASFEKLLIQIKNDLMISGYTEPLEDYNYLVV
jgi:hypothetical protein